MEAPWEMALLVVAAVQGMRARLPRHLRGWGVVLCALVMSAAVVLGLAADGPLPPWARQICLVFVLSVGGASTLKAMGRRIWSDGDKGKQVRPDA